jgi:hypothetical protein
MRKLAAFVCSVFLLAASAVASPTNAVVYIADSQNNRIRMVTLATGKITTIAGNGIGWYAGDGGPAASAELHNPMGVAVDSSGNLYIADTLNNRIRIVTLTTGTISTIAGTGTPGSGGDGGPAGSAQLNSPTAIAIDPFGNIFIADKLNNRIRKIAFGTGVITTVAGNGSCCYGGDGGLAIDAQLYYPTGVAVDCCSDLYIADTNNQRIREVNSAGIISTVGGNGTAGFSCSGGDARNTALHGPTGLAVNIYLYIADAGNNCVRVESGGFFSSIGNGIPSYGGDGKATSDPSVELNGPAGVALDNAGTLYIADDVNHRIRIVTGATSYLPGSGVIATLAGNGAAGFSGDGGPASSAQLYNPTGVAIGFLAPN